jgi:hypothetical protein
VVASCGITETPTAIPTRKHIRSCHGCDLSQQTLKISPVFAQQITPACHAAQASSHTRLRIISPNDMITFEKWKARHRNI